MSTDEELKQEYAKKLADAREKLRRNYQKIEDHKQSRRIKLIDNPPIRDRVPKTATVSHPNAPKCRAITLAGKPCSFRAMCGGLCSKHNGK